MRGAETHAVHVGEMAEVKDDLFGFRNQGLDAGGEGFGEPGDELPIASHGGEVAIAFYLEGQVAGGSCWRC